MQSQLKYISIEAQNKPKAAQTQLGTTQMIVDSTYYNLNQLKLLDFSH